MTTFSSSRWTRALALRLISSSLRMCCLNTLGDSDARLARSSFSSSMLSPSAKPLIRKPDRDVLPLLLAPPTLPMPLAVVLASAREAASVDEEAVDGALPALSPGLPFSPPAPALSSTSSSSSRPLETVTEEEAEMEATMVRRNVTSGVWSAAVLPKWASNLRWDPQK